ncbi:hypothetical protein AAFF_G00430700 [Aldrovandia affinis]|uniref:Uncharacterized protein n=1 Tax=Aldrovandia affinis TaxID=143900 RepID=A0AAD7SBE4_9TELE|nr:hypothetical protein AAFF_G00430700 [Aldrovandia affinis]
MVSQPSPEPQAGTSQSRKRSRNDETLEFLREQAAREDEGERLADIQKLSFMVADGLHLHRGNELPVHEAQAVRLTGRHDPDKASVNGPHSSPKCLMASQLTEAFSDFCHGKVIISFTTDMSCSAIVWMDLWTVARGIANTSDTTLYAVPQASQ